MALTAAQLKVKVDDAVRRVALNPLAIPAEPAKFNQFTAPLVSRPTAQDPLSIQLAAEGFVLKGDS